MYIYIIIYISSKHSSGEKTTPSVYPRVVHPIVPHPVSCVTSAEMSSRGLPMPRITAMTVERWFY